MTSGAARTPRIRPAMLPSVLGAVVLVATAPLVDTEWYTLIRYAVSVLALIVAVMALQHRRPWWALPMLAPALMWNPVLPLDLSADVWIAAHYLGGLLFLTVGLLLRVPPEP